MSASSVRPASPSISVSVWALAYYGERVRKHGGSQDLSLCMKMAIACYQMDVSRDPIEAARNDRGAAYFAMEQAGLATP